MKTFFKKQFVPVLFITLVMISSFGIPKKARALVSSVVEVGPNLVQNTINTTNTSSVSLDSYYQRYKTAVLDRLAIMAAKQLIRHITASIVDWINTGFQGSPSFLQNPSTFFLDVADQITGEFLATTGGPLVELCSPFSINIRIALAFRYHPRNKTRYSCTLSTIIGNSKTAIEGASINGFTAGDFKQGGWPAFVSLTTEPQNNVYGAYLTAESELSWRVASRQAQQRDEISAGRGFLSWRDPKCAAAVREHNKNIDESGSDASGYNQGAGTVERRSEADCPIQTPGSVIGGTLQNHLDGPLKELQLVDNINQIVDALFAQLAVQVLQKGLGTASQPGPAGTTYIDTIAAANEADQDYVRKELISSMSGKFSMAREYQKNRLDALNAIFRAKNSYDAARACYVDKTNQVDPPISVFIKDQARRRIAEIDQTVSDSITSKISNLSSLSRDADLRLSLLEDITRRAQEARSVADINTQSQRYAGILNSNQLTTPSEIIKSQEDLDIANSDADRLINDARNRLSSCQTNN